MVRKLDGLGSPFEALQVDPGGASVVLGDVVGLEQGRAKDLTNQRTQRYRKRTSMVRIQLRIVVARPS